MDFFLLQRSGIRLKNIYWFRKVRGTDIAIALPSSFLSWGGESRLLYERQGAVDLSVGSTWPFDEEWDEFIYSREWAILVSHTIPAAGASRESSNLERENILFFEDP